MLKFYSNAGSLLCFIYLIQGAISLKYSVELVSSGHPREMAGDREW